MLIRFIPKSISLILCTLSFSLSAVQPPLFTDSIEESPLILSNHDTSHNSLQGGVYELLDQAQSSILILSFTFNDRHVIELVNQKAKEGLTVELILDRDHYAGLTSQLHPSIHIGTRRQGEGHLHHKILVVDRKYIWLSSANFTPNSLSQDKNLAIGFISPTIADELHQEATNITSSLNRMGQCPISCFFGNQLLELFLLPHNAPEAPRTRESIMNEIGKQKLLSLIDNAQHHIKICVDVWTYKDASRAILNAHQRGVQVDVTVGGLGEEAVKMMIQSGVSVKQGKNLHYKFLLVDDAILLNGSLNWSMNAFSRSDESFVVLYDLTEAQLKALEGALIASGLPTSLHDNPIQNQASPSDEKVNLVNKTIQTIKDEINQAPSLPENQRLISIALRLSSDLARFIPNLKTTSVPGCCLYQGENYLSNVVQIAEKEERVRAALRYIKNQTGTDQKVNDYFQKTLKKLQSGINAPLPDYFHATKSGLENILSTQTIFQSASGLTGKGTYISCNNEGDHGYGSHAFAIDEGCLVNTGAIYRTGRHPLTNVFYSLWASVHIDIPITSSNIAFIDTSANDVAYVTSLLEQEKLDIEVVDRKTAEGILRIFDLTTKRRELPSFFWSKNDANDYLPQNMYPRSPQGTFRPFQFSG